MGHLTDFNVISVTVKVVNTLAVHLIEVVVGLT